MKRQKWSGLKLSEEEMKEIRKGERIEIMAEVLAFIFILAIGFVILSAIIKIIGGIE